MTTSQRGSVLLTVIAGLVLLALLGSAMLTLMTGSVMTGVDGREAMQAAYLAESGKEIVRVQTEKLDGGGLMGEAIDLETAGPISIDGKGGVKLQLFPSWFRWTGEELKSTDSGWYGGTPKGTHDWLEISKDGATRYRIDNVNAVKNDTFGSEAADLYLIGRVSGENGITYDAAKNTLTVKTTENDLEWFPNSGGLIGLVSQAGKDTALPAAAQVSTHRFTYDQKTSDKGTYTFTNVTRLSSSPLSTDTFKDKDIALGQYFRVLSTGRTLNDAQAALVWHTNGRGSLRSSGKGTSGGAVETLENVSDSLSDGGEKLFGKENKVGSKVKADLQIASGSKIQALNVQGLKGMCPYHFLLSPKWHGDSSDFWFAELAKSSVYQNYPSNLSIKTSDLLYQATLVPHTSAAEFFAGILFKTRLLSGSISDTPGASSGVSGLGLGIVRQKNAKDTVADPFLLPGYEFNNEILNQILFNTYNMYGFFSPEKAEHATFLVLWAYDDSLAPYGTRIQSGPTTLSETAQGAFERPLRWLAIGALTEKDVNPKENNPYCTTIAARVVSGEQENSIQAWVKAIPLNDYEQTVQWPNIKQQSAQQDKKETYTKDYRTIEWIAVNEAFAVPVRESSDGPVTTIKVKHFALDNLQHDRTGIFSGRYKETQSAGWLYFTDFAVGIPGSDGGNDDASGLTPGIVQ